MEGQWMAGVGQYPLPTVSVGMRDIGCRNKLFERFISRGKEINILSILGVLIRANMGEIVSNL